MVNLVTVITSDILFIRIYQYFFEKKNYLWNEEKSSGTEWSLKYMKDFSDLKYCKYETRIAWYARPAHRW